MMRLGKRELERKGLALADAHRVMISVAPNSARSIISASP